MKCNLVSLFLNQIKKKQTNRGENVYRGVWGGIVHVYLNVKENLQDPYF